MYHGVVKGITRCGLIVALGLAAGCGSSGEVKPMDSTGSNSTTSGPSAALGDLLPNAEELWSAAVPHEGGTLESADLCGDLIVLRGSDNKLVALDRNGIPQWIFKRLNLTPEFAPVAGPNAIALVTREDLWVIDRRTGDLMSRMTLDFTPSAPPALSASTAYVPSLSDDRIYAVSLADGKVGWRARLNSVVTASPVMAGPVGQPVLVVATERGTVFGYPALEAGAPTPDPTWTKRLPGRVTADLKLSVDAQTVLVSSEDYSLYALTAGTGEAAWVYAAGMPLTQSASHVAGPAGGPGLVFQPRGGELVALDAATGEKKWTTDSGTHGVCLWGKDYLIADGNSVRRLQAKSGTPLGAGVVSERFLVPDPATGHFIVADSNWRLRVYRHRNW